MQFLERPLAEIYDYLQTEIFKGTNTKLFNLLPDDLIERAAESKLFVNRFPIENWSKFEQWILDFDENDFKKLIFGNGSSNENSSIIFISDECLKRSIGIEFVLKDYYDFVDYYEDTFHQGFFQPLDYITIIKEYKEIRMIHHEGHVFIIRGINVN